MLFSEPRSATSSTTYQLPDYVLPAAPMATLELELKSWEECGSPFWIILEGFLKSVCQSKFLVLSRTDILNVIEFQCYDIDDHCMHHYWYGLL